MLHSCMRRGSCTREKKISGSLGKAWEAATKNGYWMRHLVQAVKGRGGSWRRLWTGVIISPLSTRTLCGLRGYSCALVAEHTNVVQATWLPLCVSG